MNLRKIAKAFCHHHTLLGVLLFVLSSVHGNEFIGCYLKDESLQKINRVHEIKVQNCVDACIEEEKVYAALETQICHCTNTKVDSRLVEGARCFPCSINQNETCGGFDVVAIYATGIKGESQQF